MNLIDFLDRGALLHPQNACIVEGEQSFSYADVQSLTHKIALALQAQGINEGAKIAVYSPNNALGLIAIMSIFRNGSAWISVNAKNGAADNIDIVKNLEADFLFYHSDVEDLIPEFKQQIPSIRGYICVDKVSEYATDMTSWSSQYSGHSAKLSENPDRLTWLASSGGTTGKPKGIELTDSVLETVIASYLITMPIEEPPVHLLVAPMSHAAGVTAFPLFAQGGTQIIMPEVSPEEIMRMIEAHKVTHLFLPPTVIYMMLAHPNVSNYDYSSLKYFLYAAAPMSAEKLAQAIETFGPVMVQCFGQAEAPMMCTFMTAKDHLSGLEKGKEHRLFSCGKPTPLVRLEIMDDEGNLLERNERGEIVVRSSLVMNGYYKNPEATAEAGEFGWHHTGDIGYIDDDGFVYIVDRKKDMIISGGFNVYPTEVEQVIWTHPDVQDCAVIGVPDEKWGEAVKAIVEPVSGKTINPDDIIKLCKDKVGSVKAPKTVETWDTLPRSPVGKVLKKEIRQKFWQNDSRKV